MGLTSVYTALWHFVVDAAEYRKELARRVQPLWFVPRDVLAVRFGDLTIHDRTLRRLRSAERASGVNDPVYGRAACSTHFAEEMAKLFYERNPLSARDVEDIKRLGDVQESIADAFYGPLRFGRLATVALAIVGLVGVPKDTAEEVFEVDYAEYAAFVTVGAAIVLGLLWLVSFIFQQRAGRRARHTRLFKAVLVYLARLADADAGGRTPPRSGSRVSRRT